MGLDRAIETVHLTLSMAARQGASQARIQLSPASLGGIRIHLQQTSNGLVARVVADHASAAQTLQQGGAELRRSLESAGVQLLRLDVETTDQQGARAGDPDAPSAGSPDGEENNPNAPEEQASEQTAQPVELPNGAVVDVLA